MRKILQFALFLLLTAGVAQAQVCTPQLIYTSLGIPGVYPNPALQNTLASGTPGVAYNETLTIIVPQDTTINLSAIFGIPGFPSVSVSVNYQVVSGITGLPAGVTYACDPANCQVPGNSNGCVKLSGTPTTAGMYSVNMATSYNVTIPAGIPLIGGTPQNVPFPGGLTWSMPIGVTAVKDAQSNSLYIAHNAPNPFHGTTSIRFHAPKASAITFEVTDLSGKQLHAENFRAIVGDNQFTYDASLLAPGIYIYKISNGENAVSSKMVVQ